MQNPAFYLKPNIVMEPLWNQWYAWSYLIAPSTASMYVLNWHLKLLESFAEAPEVHVQALQNPALIGGPFLNYPAERVADVRNLILTTRKNQEHLIALANAVRALEFVLEQEGTGGSMEAVYSKVPEPLRGMVELVYDIRNNPVIRWIEPLLYVSRFYRQESQSLSLWEMKSDERPMVFSSPRFPEAGQLRLEMPFDDDKVDEIVALKRFPQSKAYIHDLFGARASDELLDSMLTTEPPREAIGASPGGVRILYLGHACVLIQSEHTSVLCDPLLSYEYPSALKRYTYQDLPGQIDYALVTHNHQDHFHLEALLQLRQRIGQLVVPRSDGGSIQDPSLRLVLENTGFHNARDIAEFETIRFKDGSITAIPFLGEHGDLNIRSKVAYLIEIAGTRIVCAADSNNLEPEMYRHLARVYGEIDILFIGLECEGAPLSWAYGPLMPKLLPRKADQSRRLNGSNCERALGVVEQLRPKQVFIYAMGEEPWLSFIMGRQDSSESVPAQNARKFVTECARMGVPAERLFAQKEIHPHDLQDTLSMKQTMEIQTSIGA
jgi:L-ascorbate metabolism protein UlaG (beta-lactamase superfamily)